MFSFVYQDSEIKYIPVTEGDIRRIEEKFGVIFPEILKYYYIKYNAKYIHTVYFFVDSDNYEISIDDIIPLLNNIPNYDVESVKNDEDKYGWVSKSFIPFAITEGGDEIYWDSSDGKVYVVFADDGEDENGMLLSRYVCSSIDELFRIMEEEYIKEVQDQDK